MKTEDQRIHVDELRKDCRIERQLLWKELISVLVLLVLGFVREVWLK